MAAILVANTFNLPSTRVAQAIKSFKPLEHRLEVVGRYSDITFINDSIATMPEAAIVALKTFKSEVGTIIVGGYDRKQSYSKLANALEKEKVNNIVFFPTTGKRIWKEVKKAFGRKKLELPKHIFTSDIREAVKFAFENTPKGKVCLLSPAAPSFGVFKDYRERGRVFKKAVFDLQKMYN
jgi:UDP-N-acetylmuramoylalanine--D-glutamate ligase